MVTSSRPLLGAVLVVLVAAGCASRSSVRNLRADLATQRLALSELQRTNWQTGRAHARLLDRLTGVDSRIAELQAQGRQDAEQVAALRGQLAALDSSVSQVRARLDAVTREPAPSQPSPRAAVAAPGPEQLYAVALTNFRAGEHGQAVLDLIDFIAKFPQHSLAPHAQFWIGEAYYLQRDCRQALIEFKKVITRRSPDQPAADALLRIGMCHSRRRDSTSARRAWQQLVRDYPGTEAAVKARSLLRSAAQARSR
jgi:tol-pal system protein YbgF